MNKVITLSIMFLFIASTLGTLTLALAREEITANVVSDARVNTRAEIGSVVKAEVRGDIQADLRERYGEDYKARIATLSTEEKAEFRARIKAIILERLNNIRNAKGEIILEGRNVTIKELSEERKEIIAGKINARTGLNLTAADINDKTILRAYLSNGRHAYIKYMPDHASARALAVLKAKCVERNCTVELKEVGSGNKTRLAYEVKTEKDSQILLLFKNKMLVRAQVDAETGEIISVKKPWWAFLAKEKHENTSDEEIEAEVGVDATEEPSDDLEAEVDAEVEASA